MKQIFSIALIIVLPITGKSQQFAAIGYHYITQDDVATELVNQFNNKKIWRFDKEVCSATASTKSVKIKSKDSRRAFFYTDNYCNGLKRDYLVGNWEIEARVKQLTKDGDFVFFLDAHKFGSSNSIIVSKRKSVHSVIVGPYSSDRTLKLVRNKSRNFLLDKSDYYKLTFRKLGDIIYFYFNEVYLTSLKFKHIGCFVGFRPPIKSSISLTAFSISQIKNLNQKARNIAWTNQVRADRESERRKKMVEQEMKRRSDIKNAWLSLFSGASLVSASTKKIPVLQDIANITYQVQLNLSVFHQNRSISIL